jgi:CRP-like cAMP-binding protein
MDLQNINCSKNELAEKLEKTRWANDFTWQQICAVSAHMSAYTAIKDTVIFDDSSTDNTLGIVVKGKIDIIKKDSGRVPVVIATLLPSQSFGEMSLIDGEPRSAQIVAATDVEVLLFEKSDLFKLVDKQPALAFKLLWMISTMLSQRLRKTSGGLFEQLGKN